MAASKLLHDVVGDVTECPICSEVIVDSKVLPCIHTFCLKCLEQFWKEKKPGDQVPCPLCRTPFNIPEGGLSNLPKNCFVEKLLDAQKLSNTNQSVPTCDICSNAEEWRRWSSTTGSEILRWLQEQHVWTVCNVALRLSKVWTSIMWWNCGERFDTWHFHELCSWNTANNIKMRK